MPSQPDIFIWPDWPVPARVKAVTTTRRGGVSQAPFDTLNLATHVGDDPTAVAANRSALVEALGLSNEPCWLEQVHGTGVAALHEMNLTSMPPKADASTTMTPGQVCAVLTADCLPVLFCDRAGTQVAAAHAGWRGLAAGVLEAAVAAMEVPTQDIFAWLGPAIGPAAFEVGDEVRQAFVDRDQGAAETFLPQGQGHWLADIYRLARQRLQAIGVNTVFGGGLCTYQDSTRFYSYRRDGVTGRMASVIWLEESSD
jgi:YfiH family protein